MDVGNVERINTSGNNIKGLFNNANVIVAFCCYVIMYYVNSICQ